MKKTFLIIQGAKLGDMVCTTPVFRAIKDKYPDSKLVVSGDKVNKEILKGNPHIDDYLKITELSAKKINELGIDMAVLLNPNPGVLWELLKARLDKVVVPKVVEGYSPYMTKKFRLLSLFATKVPHRMGFYAPQEYLNMLRPLGIDSADTRKEVFVTKEAEAKAEEMLAGYQDMKLVAIAPGAGNRIKEWPPERFAEVAKWLVEEKEAMVVLIGTDKDRTLADVVKSGLSEKSVLDTVGKLSIEELKAVVKSMNLFVSADTGPIYLAEAWGVPTIDIVGPVDEKEQPPIGERHLVVLPPFRDKPLLHVMNARVHDLELASKLASMTRVAEVKSAIQSLL